MELGVDKSGNPLSDRVMKRDNGAVRVIGFMDFREEVERGMRMRDMEEEDVLRGETM